MAQPKITELNEPKNVEQKQTEHHKLFSEQEELNVGKAKFNTEKYGHKTTTVKEEKK